MSALPQIEYHPNGYPQLGLQARTLKVRYRSNANVRTLRKRLEQWEHAHGNPLFEARHLEKLDSRLAHELVNVYVALRERYPQVRLAFIEFAGKGGGDRLAETTSYSSMVPITQTLMLKRARYRHLDAQELLSLTFDDGMDQKTYDALALETAYIHEDCALDPTASGCLEFFTLHKKREHQKVFQERERKRELNALREVPARNLGSVTSMAANALIHEFGHLVEAEILKSGYKAAEKVYRRLSEFVFDSKNPKAAQWRYHLINYPAGAWPVHGSRAGGVLRKRATRNALREPIRQKLSKYAASYREELFAEAFAAAYSGETRTTRRQLNPFLIEIYRQGIGRKPNRKM